MDAYAPLTPQNVEDASQSGGGNRPIVRGRGWGDYRNGVDRGLAIVADYLDEAAQHERDRIGMGHDRTDADDLLEMLAAEVREAAGE